MTPPSDSAPDGETRARRAAWAARYAREPAPWRGPARLAAFALDAMRGRRVLEIGARERLAHLRLVLVEVLDGPVHARAPTGWALN